MQKKQRLKTRKLKEHQQIPKKTISAEEQDDDGATIHTSNENPILDLPITKRCLNCFNHQLKIYLVLSSPARPKTIQLIPDKERLYTKISTSKSKIDVIELYKNYDPKFTTNLFRERKLYPRNKQNRNKYFQKQCLQVN